MARSISRLTIIKEVEKFREDMGKTRFTAVELIDYMESKGYDLSYEDVRLIQSYLSARFYKERVELVEYNPRKNKLYIRSINEYQL